MSWVQEKRLLNRDMNSGNSMMVHTTARAGRMKKAIQSLSVVFLFIAEISC
jgi:hypothetical protein